MTRRMGSRVVAAGLAGFAALALIAIAVTAPRVAAAGWLIAFVFLSAIPIGSLAWLLIHRLTGGQWGNALAPILSTAATATPLLAVAFIPVLIALPLLYPWAGSAHDIAPDVRAFYLNVPLYLLRSAIAFIGWSVLVLLLPRVRGPATPLLASLGLLFHVVMIGLLSTDWILSTEPVFMSSSFGATIAVTQLLAALSFAALAAPAFGRRTARDLGGLMLALTLGITYINFMAVLVMWYGDLPDKVTWFVLRIREPWLSVAIACFVLGSLIPVAAALLARVRESHAALRWVAVSSLAGIALFDVWLLAPVYGTGTLGAAFLSIVALASVILVLVQARRPSSLFRPMRTAP
jgi:hypothetical protein